MPEAALTAQLYMFEEPLVWHTRLLLVRLQRSVLRGHLQLAALPEPACVRLRPARLRLGGLGLASSVAARTSGAGGDSALAV